MDDGYELVSIKELTTPKDGYIVLLKRWWYVKDDCVPFTKEYHNVTPT